MMFVLITETPNDSELKSRYTFNHQCLTLLDLTFHDGMMMDYTVDSCYGSKNVNLFWIANSNMPVINEKPNLFLQWSRDRGLEIYNSREIKDKRDDNLAE